MAFSIYNFHVLYMLWVRCLVSHFITKPEILDFDSEQAI